MNHTESSSFLADWQRFALDGVTFPGPKWSGLHGYPRTASADERVKGHRYDQTVASVIAIRRNMNEWFSKTTFEEYFYNDRRATYIL
jgi:hypothetical protein